MTQAQILVSGATGTTGGEIIRQLDAAGIKARALVRDKTKAASLISSNIELAHGDLADGVSLKTAMRGMQTAYLNIVPGPDALQQVDTFLAAAKAAGVTHIVKLSGMHASADSRSAIIRMHAEADRRVVESGLTYTLLRANSFFQNILTQMDGIKENGQFYLPMGDARQSLIDVADIAAVAITVLTGNGNDSATYDLSGPQSLTFHDVAEALSSAMGHPVSYVPISTEAFRQSLVGVGMPDEAAESVAEIFSVFAEGWYSEVSHDVEKVLGRLPRSFQDFANDLKNMI